jgi:hypothetical protein
MSHDPRFSIIPGWIVTDPRLKGRDLQVLCLLGRHTDKQGWCIRSQVKMAAQLNCARSTVQASLDRLSDIGVVEKHEQSKPDGRDSAHFYRVIYDRAPASGYAFDAWQDGEKEENIPLDVGETGTPPADISAPPAGPGSAPPAGPGSAPINDPSLTTLAERREREARERENEDDPKVLMKRVKALEIGKNNNPWPGVLGSSSNWTMQQLKKLPPDERDMAEERRDDYLAICKASGVDPVPLGTYLRDRRFFDITPQAVRAANDKLDRIAIKPFGPVWGGMRAFALGKGPQPIELPGDLRDLEELKFNALKRSNEGLALRWLAKKGIELSDDGKLIFPDDFERSEYRRRQVDEGFADVNRLHKLAADHKSELTNGRNQALADLCEAVPVGSDAYEAWRAFHQKMQWPLWPDPGNMKVVWFPKGGPNGFEAFLKAAKAALEGRREDEGDVHAAAE